MSLVQDRHNSVLGRVNCCPMLSHDIIGMECSTRIRTVIFFSDKDLFRMMENCRNHNIMQVKFRWRIEQEFPSSLGGVKNLLPDPGLTN